VVKVSLPVSQYPGPLNYVPDLPLRSATTKRLAVSSVNRSQAGFRGCRSTDVERAAESLSTLRQHPKTHMFTKCFSDHFWTRLLSSSSLCHLGQFKDPGLIKLIECLFDWCVSVSCYPSCQHGGYCSTPNQCECAPGYTGSCCQL